MDEDNNNIVICSRCYEQNTYGEKYCYNCGKKLYYNDENIDDEVALEEQKKNFKKEFDDILEFNDRKLAINKEKQELYFFYDDELEKIIKFNTIIECQIIKDSNVMERGRSWKSNCRRIDCRTEQVQL